MLLHLSVGNFILIQNLNLSFHKGFTCISGETGAGKSILVGALGLILGQRADSQVLMDKTKKCIVEGSFLLEGYGLESIFNTYDIDYEQVSTFRREINPQGKSRAFINDTPVNLNVLKEIGERLVDIHSQNQTLELNEKGFQLAIVDAYSNNASLLNRYTAAFSEFQKLKTELIDCIEQDRKANADREYLEFQLDELGKANLIDDFQENAEAELSLLTHAEEIKSKLFSALQNLSESDQNVLSGLSDTRQAIANAARFSNQLDSVSARLENCILELKEIVTEIRSIDEHINYDPERILQLTQGLDFIYHLEQKHKLSTINELIALREEIILKISSLDSLQERISNLKNLQEKLESELATQASILSKNRIAAIPEIEKVIQELLIELGMPSARFTVLMEKTEHFTHTGTDRLSFHFSANKGGEMRELHKVASGGELSRLMLAIKSMIVSRSLLPTILFDEIDSGVSGEIAGKIGSILRKMSETLQVITITHLPQIAGKAHEHLLAFKIDGDQNTVSHLKKLTKEERINEIARMLSDETITETARAAARELIVN